MARDGTDLLSPIPDPEVQAIFGSLPPLYQVTTPDNVEGADVSPTKSVSTTADFSNQVDYVGTISSDSGIEDGIVGGAGVPDGYVETSVTICDRATNTATDGSILFKAD